MYNYHKGVGKPRYTLKVDLTKAYDSVSWGFILLCLRFFGVPTKFICWVKECITSPSFSISLNGSLVGFFQGKKGLRQGDFISPYLFVIAMEVLSLMLEETANGSSGFSFHLKCSAINLTHQCFADDLLIFYAVKLTSVKAIKEVLLEFEDLSGLKANPAKSVFFCAGIEDDDKKELLDLLQMQEGTLLVRYLGVPLVTKSLSAADCASLVSRITARMNSWLVRHLSFAGRLQLLNSVLFSLQSYWT